MTQRQTYIDLTVGQRLKMERHRLGLSEAAMALRTGQSKDLLIRLERGEALPSGNALHAMLAAGADIVFIMCGERGPTDAPSPVAFAEVMFRQALAQLAPLDRISLLTRLLQGELDA